MRVRIWASHDSIFCRRDTRGRLIIPLRPVAPEQSWRASSTRKVFLTDSSWDRKCVKSEAPEYPAPTMRMSHSVGSTLVVRWLSRWPGRDRQKDGIPLGGGNGFEVIVQTDAVLDEGRTIVTSRW